MHNTFIRIFNSRFYFHDTITIVYFFNKKELHVNLQHLSILIPNHSSQRSWNDFISNNETLLFKY